MPLTLRCGVGVILDFFSRTVGNCIIKLKITDKHEHLTCLGFSCRFLWISSPHWISGQTTDEDIADRGSLTHRCVFSCLLESCFRASLTHRAPPLFCQQGYLKQQGVSHNGQLRQYVHDTGPTPTEQDAGKSGADPAFPNYLAQAGASVSSGLKLDFWLFLSVLKLCLWCCLSPSDLLPPAPIINASSRPNMFGMPPCRSVVPDLLGLWPL